MKHKATIHEQHALLSNLHQLPRKILLFHGSENVPEFVLHELCHEKCFNVHKAAYFVDNPDFDCLKGVAGIHHKEEMLEEDIWQNPDSFSQQMKESPFNQKVRSIHQQSAQKKHLQEQELAKLLANELEIKKPKLLLWNLKHDNHGVFIFEEEDDNHVWDEEYLLNGVHLLGFCPVH